jgi:hypothetical protein
MDFSCGLIAILVIVIIVLLMYIIEPPERMEVTESPVPIHNTKQIDAMAHGYRYKTAQEDGLITPSRLPGDCSKAAACNAFPSAMFENRSTSAEFGHFQQGFSEYPYYEDIEQITRGYPGLVTERQYDDGIPQEWRIADTVNVWQRAEHGKDYYAQNGPHVYGSTDNHSQSKCSALYSLNEPDHDPAIGPSEDRF